MWRSVFARQFSISLISASGAVMTQEYADKIGADAYSKDAMQTVRYCDEVFGV